MVASISVFFFACFSLRKCVVFRISSTYMFLFFHNFLSLSLQIWREINLVGSSSRHQWTLWQVTSKSFHPTPLHLFLTPNRTLPPHNRTPPSFTQDLTPDLPPTHHSYILGTHLHVRTFQDHAKSTRFNINCGGDGRRSTRPQTDGKIHQFTLGWHWGGHQATLVRVNERGRRPWRVHILELCQLFFSLRATNSLMPTWSAECENPTSAHLIALVVTITPLLLLYHIRTFYITRCTSSTTHPSQPAYTFNELQKRKKKKKQRRRKTQQNKTKQNKQQQKMYNQITTIKRK